MDDVKQMSLFCGYQAGKRCSKSMTDQKSGVSLSTNLHESSGNVELDTYENNNLLKWLTRVVMMHGLPGKAFNMVLMLSLGPLANMLNCMHARAHAICA
jgi:hypothetical protein